MATGWNRRFMRELLQREADRITEECRAAHPATLRARLYTGPFAIPLADRDGRQYASGGTISPRRDPDDDSVTVVLSHGYGAWIPAETWNRCSSSELTTAVLGSAADLTHYDHDLATLDETTSTDSLDCSSSNGARWSDLMTRIDELTDDAP